MITETCGAGREITTEKKDQPNRLDQESFVTLVNGQPVGDGQHFVGVGVVPENLREFIQRCNRCKDCPVRGCDISTGTFQDFSPQEVQNS